MDITAPIRKNILLATTVFVLPVAPKVPVYPATEPIIAKLQAQVKTLTMPNRKTAIRAIIPVCSELNSELIHSCIFSRSYLLGVQHDEPAGVSLHLAGVALCGQQVALAGTSQHFSDDAL